MLTRFRLLSPASTAHAAIGCHRIVLAVWLLLFATLAHATAPSGEYRAVIDGVPSVMTLSAAGETLSGHYREGELNLEIKGRHSGKRLSGTLRDPVFGIPVATFDGTHGDGHLNLRIVATNPVNGQSRTVDTVFSRPGATAPAAPKTASPASGKTDARLVGRWVNESHINSGGPDFAGFSTVRTFELAADGRATQSAVSAGGGSDWSYGSGRPEIQFSGQWQAADGVLYLRADGQSEFVAAARYRFADPYLITEDAGNGRLNWRRAR